MSLDILSIKYTDHDADKQFEHSIKHSGFAVINDHPIESDLIDQVYEDWKNYFSSEDKTKYLFDEVKQDGYFPYLSEHAKGSNIKDLKEFYHIYSWGRYPSQISKKTNDLIIQFKSIAEKLLFQIHEHSPNEIKDYFSMPLDTMIQNSGQNLLRIIHYPPLSGSENSKAIRAAAHEDINLITLLVAGSEPGLQVLSQDGDWVDVSTSPDYIIVNVGDMLQECSQNFYPSTTHRVINPLDQSISRYSMPFFVHARDEVVLSENYTAKSYLEERLKEIGLK